MPTQEKTDAKQIAQSGAVYNTYRIVDRFTIQWSMIISFRHKGLETFYRTGSTRGIQSTHAPKLGRILGLLDVAEGPQAMNIPSFKLHQLKGDLAGYW